MLHWPRRPGYFDKAKEFCMYIRSTGLGKTLLQCRVEKVESCNLVPETLQSPKEGESEPTRLLMTMKVIAPVSWTVRAFVEPADLRRIIGFTLRNPQVLFKGLSFLTLGGKSPSLEVKKKGQASRGVGTIAPSIPTDVEDDSKGE
jgi:hypothetical protein